MEKPNVALEEGWKKDDNGLMVQLDLPCCIFDVNFLEIVDAFVKLESDKSLPKFYVDSTMSFNCISRG